MKKLRIRRQKHHPHKCPICVKGKRKDSKTGEERDCRACNGTGKLKYEGDPLQKSIIGLIQDKAQTDIEKLIWNLKQ